ncbi:MAG: hypothetical protein ACI9S6_001207 [Reinekea sp.]
MGEGLNLKVNDCLSEASCYERLKFIPERKGGLSHRSEILRKLPASSFQLPAKKLKQTPHKALNHHNPARYISFEQTRSPKTVFEHTDR